MTSKLAFWIAVAFAFEGACSLQMPKESELFGVAGRGPAAGGSMPASGSSTSRGGSAGRSGTGGHGGAGASEDAVAGAGGASGDTSGSGGAAGGESGGGAGGQMSGAGGAVGGGSNAGGSLGNAGSNGAGVAGAGGFDAQDGLIAHFEFDESDGNVAANARDASKSGTYQGACTHPAGRIGLGVSIRNLATGTVDWVELPPALLSGLSATTVAVWVRDLSTARAGSRLFQFSTSANQELFFAPDDARASSSLAGAHLGGTHDGVVFVDLWSQKPALTDKDWHHVAVTWNSVRISLYIDGRSVGSAMNPDVSPADLGATSADWVGRTRDDAQIGLYAEIDELRIYDSALSASAIAELYALR